MVTIHYRFGFYAGKILNDSISLEAAGVKKDSTVLLYPKIETTRPSPSTGGDPQKNKDNIVACVKELVKMRALHAIGKPPLMNQRRQARSVFFIHKIM